MAGKRGRSPFVLSPEVSAQLGVRSDREIAAHVGCSDITIAKHRRALGRPHPLHDRKSASANAVAWLADNPNATLTDAAHRFGLRTNTIYQAKRRRAGIPLADKIKPTNPAADTAMFRCKITGGRFVEMRLPTANFTRSDVDRITAFLITLLDE